MATQHLATATRMLDRLDLGESAPDGKVHFIDTPEQIASLVTTLYSLNKKSRVIGVDLEGVNLSRYGSISLLQIWVPAVDQAFVVDVHTLGKHAFNVSNPEGKSLRDVLSSKAIQKYFFDVRNDSDALFAHFKIQLAGVVDVQLLELASRPGPKHVVRGLKDCIQQEQVLQGAALRKWQDTKAKVIKMFDAEQDGSYEIWNVRPLSPAFLIDYCIGDVQFLPVLAAIYKERLDPQWLERVRNQTRERINESMKPNYQPTGRKKIFGPRQWRFPPPVTHNRGVITTFASSSSSVQNALTKSPKAVQEKVDKSQKQPLIRFVSERSLAGGGKKAPQGDEKNARSRVQSWAAMHAYNVGARHDSLYGNDDQNWALCDKDCGWCGHCGDGII